MVSFLKSPAPSREPASDQHREGCLKKCMTVIFKRLNLSRRRQRSNILCVHRSHYTCLWAEFFGHHHPTPVPTGYLRSRPGQTSLRYLPWGVRLPRHHDHRHAHVRGRGRWIPVHGGTLLPGRLVGRDSLCSRKLQPRGPVISRFGVLRLSGRSLPGKDRARLNRTFICPHLDPPAEGVPVA